MYRLVNPYEIYDDDNVCEQLGIYRKSHPDALTAPYSLVFPNPGDKEIILKYYLPSLAFAHANIYNASMQLVNTFDLNINGKELNISTENLAEGLYLYNIVQDGKAVSSGKFSVIH